MCVHARACVLEGSVCVCVCVAWGWYLLPLSLLASHLPKARKGRNSHSTTYFRPSFSKRAQVANAEANPGNMFDHTLVNADVEETYQQIKQLISRYRPDILMPEDEQQVCTLCVNVCMHYARACTRERERERERWVGLHQEGMVVQWVWLCAGLACLHACY